MHTPYPFENLPKLTRSQVHALSQMRALFSEGSLERARRTAEQLLGAALACSPELPEAIPRGRFVPRAHAVWVELEPEHAWLELPTGLCELLVERVLGGDGAAGGVPAGTQLDPLSSGALAYLIARCCAETPLCLRGVSCLAPQLSDADVVCWPVELSCGDARARVRLYVPASLLLHERGTRHALRSLPRLALSLWAEAGRTLLDLGTLRSLAAGDVVVLDHASIARARDGQLEGAVSVRVQGSASAIACRLCGERLEVESIACTWEPSTTRGRRMPDDNHPSQPESTLARDAPIELSLEIARFQLSLGELERVRAGDVLLTGRRIGELVTLRAAGQAFAEGELVDVEGELGVRITRVLSPDQGPIV